MLEPPYAERYSGRRVLLVGGTGFLGSVTLSLLLQHLPHLERVWVVMRRSPGLPAERRFRERVLPGVPFDPLRARFGQAELDRLLATRVRVLEGDVSLDRLGLDAATLEELEGSLDLVVNCSGLVDFHAPLERAYRVNVLGTRNLIELCGRTGASLVHTSTAYVAGRRAGRVEERVEPGDFPRSKEAPFLRFDPEREIADLRAELEAIEREAETQQARARFNEQAVERFRRLHGGYPAPAQLENAVRRAARDHLAAAGVEAGRRRAEFWGWPNVYTYSKSLGEQLIAASPVRWAIVRPTIVESALEYPVAGWNQNATTTAPLVMLALAGFRLLPGEADHVLDVVPVDQVAWGILAVGAATLAGEQRPVYQIGTGDTNPCTLRRLADLIGLYTHAEALAEPDASAARRLWRASREAHLLSEAHFRKRTELIRGLAARLRRQSARWQSGGRHRRVRALLEAVETRAETAESELEQAVALWDVFLPFSHELDYRFETRNIRELAARGNGPPYPFDPAAIDWRHYWLEVHIPGLRRWVLAESASPRLKPVAAAIPLPDRVEGVAVEDAYRRALSYGTVARPFALTYGEVWRLAGAGAAALEARFGGTEAGIGVVTDPAEPWPVALLAVLRAGMRAVLIPPGAWRGSFTGLKKAGLVCCVRVPGPGRVQLVTARETGEELAADGVGGAPAPRTGVSSTPRTGAVGFLLAENKTWRVVHAEDESALARRLSDLGTLLGLTERERAVVPAVPCAAEERGPLGLLLLALLYHGAEVELVHAAEMPEVVREVAPTLVATTAAAWEEVGSAHALAAAGTLRAVADLAGIDAAHLEPLLRGGVRVERLRWEGMPLVAPAKAPRGEAESGAPLFPSAGLRDVRLLSDGPGGTRVLAVVEPSRLRSVQALRKSVQSDAARHNARVELDARIAAVGVSLITGGRDAGPGGSVLWLPTRAHGSEAPHDDPDSLLQQSVALFAGVFGAPELEFFVRQLLAEPLTLERLRVWEQVLLRGARDGNLSAQVFLQRFEWEWRRTRRLQARLARGVGALRDHVRGWLEQEDPSGPLLPEPVNEAVRSGVGAAAHALFRFGMRVTVRGAAYLPAQENFLVVANHSSHLDAGLVKHALGAWGRRLHTLAAKDYFFSTPARRFVAYHFTRLIPTDRQRVSSEWLRRAREVLAGGDCVLIFPEGTRTPGSEVRPFKASLGTLVRAARVPVLPVFISGSDRVLPKGGVVPRGRRVSVHVGPLIPLEVLDARTEGVPPLQQDRAVAALLHSAVTAVPEGRFWWLEPAPTAVPPALPPAARAEGSPA